jgi:hypothetical protein
MFTSITLFLAIFFLLVTLFVTLLVLSWIIELIGRPAKLLFRALFRF